MIWCLIYEDGHAKLIWTDIPIILSTIPNLALFDLTTATPMTFRADVFKLWLLLTQVKSITTIRLLQIHLKMPGTVCCRIVWNTGRDLCTNKHHLSYNSLMLPVTEDTWHQPHPLLEGHISLMEPRNFDGQVKPTKIERNRCSIEISTMVVVNHHGYSSVKCSIRRFSSYDVC